MKEVSLLYCLPDNPFFSTADNNSHAVQDAAYACAYAVFSSNLHFSDKIADCGWIFAQHFCNRLGASYLALKNVLDETNPTHEEVLMDIKRRFRDETFTRESIANVIHAHPELVRKRILSYIPYGVLIFKCRSACST
jgi:glutamate dehydrogenase